MCIWGSEVPPSGPAEKLSRPYKLLITEKQKKPPANKMNSVLYNYKYMYRRCRNIWTYVNESKSAFAETCTAKDRILEQLHRPTPRSSDPCPPFMNSTADGMPCCKTQSLWFALFFSFFKFLFISGGMRDILGRFWIHSCWSSTVERDTLQQLKKSNCVVRPSLAWLDWRQPAGKANLMGRAHK